MVQRMLDARRHARQVVAADQFTAGEISYYIDVTPARQLLTAAVPTEPLGEVEVVAVVVL